MSQEKIKKDLPQVGFGHGRRGMTGEKAKNFKGTIRRLVDYMSPYKVKIFVVIFFAILSTASMIVGPKIMGQATTKLFEGLMGQLKGTGKIDFSFIGNILIWTLGLYLLSALFSYIMGWIMTMPQVLKIWLNKDASGVSFLSWLSYSILGALWIFYGILHKDRRIIIVYSGFVILNTLVVIGTLLYG